jgi:hypothetical protein
LRVGKAQIERGNWDGGLWLKRLNEMRLGRDGIAGVNEIAACLQPRLWDELQQRCQTEGRSLAELQHDPLQVIRRLFVERSDVTGRAVPGLLYATQIRLSAMKNMTDDSLTAKTALLEAELYAIAGNSRDARESAHFAIRLLTSGEFTRDDICDAANSLILTADHCDAKRDASAARWFREAARAVCDSTCEQYLQATVGLARASMDAGDLREAFRFAEDANRPEVAKDSVGQQIVSYLLGMIKTELTGDLRHFAGDTEVLADQLGGPQHLAKVVRSHFEKLRQGKPLSDEELWEGAKTFVECARHSVECNNSPVAGYFGAIRLLLSMENVAPHRDFLEELLAEAANHVDSEGEESGLELESFRRVANLKSKTPPPPLQAPAKVLSLDAIARKLRGDKS